MVEGQDPHITTRRCVVREVKLRCPGDVSYQRNLHKDRLQAAKERVLEAIEKSKQSIKRGKHEYN